MLQRILKSEFLLLNYQKILKHENNRKSIKKNFVFVIKQFKVRGGRGGRAVCSVNSPSLHHGEGGPQLESSACLFLLYEKKERLNRENYVYARELRKTRK